MSYQEHEVTTRDGRRLEVASVGDPAGATVVFHHGSPSAANHVKFLEAVAAPAGLFALCASRPGYGASSRQIGRRVASVVADVDDVLDALGRDEYVALGWSGGGPHALACAALGAPRCAAAWSIAGVVPLDVDFDWTAGMGPENVEEFNLAREGGPHYEEMMVEAGAKFGAATPDTVVELFGGLLSEPDLAVMAKPAERELFAATCVQGFSQGHWGFYDDDRAFLSPWGFDPAKIAVPTSIWYGDADLMVPSTHGDWLSAHVPGARVVHRAEEGHLSIVSNHLDELVAELAAAGA